MAGVISFLALGSSILVCVMLVLLMTAGEAGHLQKDPPQSISPEFS
jgi:hypothetical protein